MSDFIFLRRLALFPAYSVQKPQHAMNVLQQDQPACMFHRDLDDSAASICGCHTPEVCHNCRRKWAHLLYKAM